MPHEFLDFESHSVEGLMLSAALLEDYRIAEGEEMQKERQKSPKARQGSSRASRLKGSHSGRVSRLPKKKK